MSSGFDTRSHRQVVRQVNSLGRPKRSVEAPSRGHLGHRRPLTTDGKARHVFQGSAAARGRGGLRHCSRMAHLLTTTLLVPPLLVTAGCGGSASGASTNAGAAATTVEMPSIQTSPAEYHSADAIGLAHQMATTEQAAFDEVERMKAQVGDG